MNYAMLVLNKDGEVIFDTGPYDGDCEEAGRSMKLAKARWEKRGYEVEFRERRKVSDLGGIIPALAEAWRKE